MKHKLHLTLVLSLILVSSIKVYPQTIPDDSLYLGQNRPGITPEIFAPGIVSLPGRDENVVTFSPDGSQCFFSIGAWPNRVTMLAEYKNGAWTTPVTASFSTSRSCDEPFFSPDGNRVYYYAYTPGSSSNSDICYSQKNDTLWSDPINTGTPLNSSSDEYHPCTVADSSIYFVSSSGSVCRSQYSGGVYQARTVLPGLINDGLSSSYLDAYVASDESYLVFNSKRSGGYGGYDLYISYKKPNGSWTNPKNLGNKINSSADDMDGDITPGGKYMSFCRSTGDIYWVSASFIDSLKYTNFVPYVKRTIPNQTAVKDSLFHYQIPDSTFIDDDGNNTLSYTATLSNGSSLPVWLSFDSVTYTFSGTPDTVTVYNVKVTATDTAGASVSSAAFRITVTNPPTGIEKENGQIPKGFTLDQNYPNPFNPSTTIRYSLAKSSFVRLTIFNLLGQKIRTLQNAFQTIGEYSLVWDATDERNNSVSSGIYFYRIETNDCNLQKKMILVK